MPSEREAQRSVWCAGNLKVDGPSTQQFPARIRSLTRNSRRPTPSPPSRFTYPFALDGQSFRDHFTQEVCSYSFKHN